MIGFLIAVISGLLMSVQGVFNTQVTKTTGMWVANAFVQFTASSGRHSVLERPFPEANGRPFFS